MKRALHIVFQFVHQAQSISLPVVVQRQLNHIAQQFSPPQLIVIVQLLFVRVVVQIVYHAHHLPNALLAIAAHINIIIFAI